MAERAQALRPTFVHRRRHGTKPSHPETSRTAGCGPGVSGRNVRYCAAGLWAALGDADSSRTATIVLATIARHLRDVESLKEFAEHHSCRAEHSRGRCLQGT